ncbi:MAG: HAMP domain-containing protein [Sphaerospermopsis sp. SIO1G2]|nr:HAMP domain-containing protein [Sphaerospermopsis sp. SIO1G2]
MSIRNRLIMFVSILGLCVSSFASYNFYKEFQSHARYKQAHITSLTIELLLEAAGHWAVERGVTNSALSSAAIVNDDTRSLIMMRRDKGDAAYKKAVSQMASYDLPEKSMFLEEVHTAYEQLVTIRIAADENMGKPQILRNTKVLKSWVPTMSALIITSQDLRFRLTEQTASTNAELGRQAKLKHFSWLMSEYAGRERAIVGGLISANRGITEKKLVTLAKYRGIVESGWNIVQKLSAASNASVLETVRITGQEFFSTYDKVRNAFYDAAINGEPLPLTAKEWITVSTNAINTILATQQASTEETTAYIDALLHQAFLGLLMNAALLIAALCISAYAMYVVIRNVTTPINQLTNCMHQLANGNTSVLIPGSGRSDEIGQMAQSVQIFKDNAIKRIMLEQEQKAAELREQERLEQEHLEEQAREQQEREREREEAHRERQRLVKEQQLEEQRKAEAEAERQRSIKEQEDHIASEVSGIITACTKGDYSQRLETQGKQGLLLTLSQSMNDIGEVTQNGLTMVRSALQALSEGNLTYRIDAACHGVFNDIKIDFNNTVAHLQNTVQQIKETADSVSSASQEISQGSHDLSHRTESQAATLEETAASTESITGKVKENANNAQTAKNLSNTSSQLAQEGGQVIEEMTKTVEDIKDASVQVSNIVSLIDEIAFQTNLLALNAAVEAARAGDAGKGFAVVASEVRSLAGRSAAASKEIKDLIHASIEQVDIGVSLANQSGEALQQIITSVADVLECINVISESSKEQANDIGEIHLSVSTMDDMTQQNAALVEENTAAARSMADQGQRLVELMEFFRVDNV